MKKLLAVMLLIACVFALVAFYDKLPKLPEYSSSGTSEKGVSIPLDGSWPEEFAMFPPYNGNGTLTQVSAGERTMLRFYEDISHKDINEYLTLLTKQGFTQNKLSAQKIENDLLYQVLCSAQSETRYQITYSISNAPPKEPLPTLIMYWSNTVGGNWQQTPASYTVRAEAPADENGEVHKVTLLARCDSTSTAQKLAMQLTNLEGYGNIEQKSTSVYATYTPLAPMDFAGLHAHFAHDVEQYHEETIYQQIEEE